jgi:hypothetical protein
VELEQDELFIHHLEVELVTVVLLLTLQSSAYILLVQDPS